MAYRIYNGMRILNPVFKGKLYRLFYLGWDVPVYMRRIFMTVPVKEPLNWRMYNSDAKPVLTEGVTWKRLALELASVPGYRYADKADERIVRALEFVQDEICYLGMGLGLGSIITFFFMEVAGVWRKKRQLKLWAK